MTTDDTATREAFEAWWKNKFMVQLHEWDYATPNVEAAWHVWLAASRSIPAAAALLRAHGWRVEEPQYCDCERGHNGLGMVGRICDCQDCPTCNGTGARP